jgi:hypothetical protein
MHAVTAAGIVTAPAAATVMSQVKQNHTAAARRQAWQMHQAHCCHLEVVAIAAKLAREQAVSLRQVDDVHHRQSGFDVRLLGQDCNIFVTVL